MKTRILRYFKHISLTLLTLAVVAIIFGLSQGASLTFGENPMAMKLGDDGPYIFYKNDSTLSVNYIRGGKEEGFSIDSLEVPASSKIPLTSFHPLDSSEFTFDLVAQFTQPPTTYQDDQPILAVSDIEGNYLTFRNFLIKSGVIDDQLNWTFGKGHLVLVGDFVDRGFFVSQVLWFIYKLEMDAAESGGRVHFIIGNHELKTMQGDYMAAAPKYYYVASILGKQQFELYNRQSVIGKWLASKNAMELINGNLFVHGGIHPDVAKSGWSLDSINQTIRENYGKMYFSKGEDTTKQLILSTETGPCWYRGYFKEDLTQVQISDQLRAFNAKAIVVGHTLQWKVKAHFEGKIIALDVRHPNDHRRTWPTNGSQGLLIEKGTYYRLTEDGEKEAL